MSPHYHKGCWSVIRSEIKRRIKQIRDSSPTKRRKEAVEKEITRISKSIDKLLDAYQDGLIGLEELRKHMPGLRKRQESLKAELNSLEVASASHQGFPESVTSTLLATSELSYGW